MLLSRACSTRHPEVGLLLCRAESELCLPKIETGETPRSTLAAASKAVWSPDVCLVEVSEVYNMDLSSYL